MDQEKLKKLFIFMGVLLVAMLLGPYFGIHLLGKPVISERKHPLGQSSELPPIALPSQNEELPPLPDDPKDQQMGGLEEN